MDDRTEKRILEKVQYVRDALTVLARKRDSLSLSEYRSQREQRDIVEREFQTAIEACIDISQMILKANGDDVPSTNAAVFLELGTQNILDGSTAQQMAKAAGFRNVLSHRYGDDINDEYIYIQFYATGTVSVLRISRTDPRASNLDDNRQLRYDYSYLLLSTTSTIEHRICSY